ncbi:MAG: hypothetical protein MK222_00740 [Candidatus Poseidoniia archaeon]|nr:hypothetical protein [Candidatus Poseidoniia archaeon]
MNNKTEASLEKLRSVATRIAASLENLVELKVIELGLEEDFEQTGGDEDGLSRS